MPFAPSAPAGRVSRGTRSLDTPLSRQLGTNGFEDVLSRTFTVNIPSIFACAAFLRSVGIFIPASRPS